jgi:hypothetical protein
MTTLKIPRYLWAAFYKDTGKIYAIRTTRIILQQLMTLGRQYDWRKSFIIKRIEVKK